MEIKPKRITNNDNSNRDIKGIKQSEDGTVYIGGFRVSDEITIADYVMRLCYESVEESSKSIEAVYVELNNNDTKMLYETRGSIRDCIDRMLELTETSINVTYKSMSELSILLEEYTDENLRINMTANTLAGGE